ncbi:MAG: Ribonuclease P protein component [Chlamydiae bacterium]|nr:Ribonuclease P protein component [Chlamydiota bacterium]
MTKGYSKALRLRKSYQYKQVLHQGAEFRGKLLIVCAHFHPNYPLPQLGVVASRHYGNAIARNRFKRLSREAFREAKGVLPKGIQIIIKPRKYALDASMQDILDELLFLSKEVVK